MFKTLIPQAVLLVLSLNVQGQEFLGQDFDLNELRQMQRSLSSFEKRMIERGFECTDRMDTVFWNYLADTTTESNRVLSIMESGNVDAEEFLLNVALIPFDRPQIDTITNIYDSSALCSAFRYLELTEAKASRWLLRTSFDGQFALQSKHYDHHRVCENIKILDRIEKIRELVYAPELQIEIFEHERFKKLVNQISAVAEYSETIEESNGAFASVFKDNEYTYTVYSAENRVLIQKGTVLDIE
jgi:hypothetical protein